MVQQQDPPVHDLPQATPEVISLTSLLSPGDYSWMRLFISLNVLLVFLLVAYFKGGRQPVAVKAGKKRKGASTVLLVGPLASGKTALFSKLVYGHAPETHTSMRENEGTVKAKWGAGADETGEKEVLSEKEGEESAATPLATPLHLVDIPGHPRLRTRSLAQYLPAADGIVFTIDASSGLTGKNARDAGEHFHILISLLSLLSQRQSVLPPVLILLSKSDLLTSSSSSSSTSVSSTASPASKSKSPSLTLDRAKQSLLRELERRRLAATGASSASSGSKGGSVPLSAGAKLEGLEAIPAGASSGSGGAVKSLLSSLGLGTASSSSAAATALNETAAGLPSDEGEILSNEDAFGFEAGAVDWEKLERAAGTEFTWALGSVKAGGEGMGKVWEFVEGL
ncbi:hypothetical protein JCM6882_008760 [Rhodosporidiobolus microsporus]